MRICKPALLAAALSLAGVSAPASAVALTSAVGDYAIGTAAFARSDLGPALQRFDAAMAADPANLTIRRAAFEAALIAGDRKRVDAIALTLPPGGGQDSVLVLLRLVRAVEHRDWRRATAAADEAERLKLLGTGLPLVARAWAQYGAGDTVAALALLRTESAPAGALAAASDSRARMLAAAGRWTEARAAYAGLLLGGGRGADIRIAAADAAANAGDPAAAAELLAQRQPSGALERARARLAARQPLLERRDPGRAAMAALLGAIAGEIGQREPQRALPFARLAVFMDSRADVERLRLATLLARGKQTDAAMAVLDAVPPHSLWSGEARALAAQILIDADRRDDALALLRRDAAVPGAGPYEWVQLAQALVSAKAYTDAAASYDRAIALSGPGAARDWTLWFQRGSAFEQAGDWARAEPDLRRATELAPREAIALNYLGYSLVDRGLKLEEGTKLLQTALRLAPNSAAIQDSLGWAYYRGGRYAEAINLLQRASEGEPGDASIAEHLGDAYWQAGRRIEARFRWNAAVALDPDEAQRKRIAAKIDYGLDRAALAGAGAVPGA